MKLLHFADSHFGMENYGFMDSKTGLHSRFLDFLNTFDQIVEIVKNEKIDIVLFAGDAYKTREPNPTQIAEFAKRVRTISKICPLVAVVGNHDTPTNIGKSSTLEVFKALETENVYLINKPEIIDVKTKSGIISVIGIPWPTKADLFPGEDSKNPDLTKKTSKIITDLINKVSPRHEAVLLGHFSAQSATMGSEQLIYLGLLSEAIVPLSILDSKKLKYVGLGHLHKYQQLPSKNVPIVYSGSVDRIDFSESQEDKGIVIYDTFKNTKPKFVPLKVRNFLEIILDIDDKTNQQIVNELKKYNLKNAVVKIQIKGLDENLESFDSSILNKELERAYYTANISIVSKTSLKQTQKLVLSENLSELESLEKYIDELKYSKNKKEKIIKLAKEILSEI